VTIVSAEDKGRGERATVLEYGSVSLPLGPCFNLVHGHGRCDRVSKEWPRWNPGARSAEVLDRTVGILRVPETTRRSALPSEPQRPGANWCRCSVAAQKWALIRVDMCARLTS
jgi:hypothetical protein